MQPTSSGPPADERDQALVVLRPVASPLPLGLFAVAGASATVSAYQAGLLPPLAAPAVALVLAPIAVVHLVVVVVSLLARDPTAAVVMAAFGVLWAVEAALLGLSPPAAGSVLGLFSVLLAVFALIATVLARVKLVLAAVLGIAVPRLTIGGLAELLSSRPWTLVTGVLGLVLSAAAVVAAVALLVEDVGGVPVALVGRRGPAEVAFRRSSVSSEVVHEAGVRRTL